MIKQRLGLFEPISVFCYICKSIFISHNVQVFGKSVSLPHEGGGFGIYAEDGGS